jgi:GNAT superfamily N-acetyltransferase
MSASIGFWETRAGELQAPRTLLDLHETGELTGELIGDFHLQGQHDQKSHGNRGGRLGPKVLNDDPNRFAPPKTWSKMGAVDDAVTSMLDSLNAERDDGVTFEFIGYEHRPAGNFVAEMGTVEVRINDPDGKKIGSVGREFLFEDGEFYGDGGHMYAANLRVADDWQGKGIGTQVQEAFEDFAAASGFAAVKVDAVGVGRYTWARAGYDFAPQASLMDSLADWSRIIKQPELQARFDAAATELRAQRSGTRPVMPDIAPTPWEVAEVVDRPESNGYGSWLAGPWAYAPSWQGTKRLRVVEDDALAASGVRPRQERLDAVIAAYDQWWPRFPAAAEGADDPVAEVAWAELFGEPGLIGAFHLQGQHDQKTHGRRGGTVSGGKPTWRDSNGRIARADGTVLTREDGLTARAVADRLESLQPDAFPDKAEISQGLDVLARSLLNHAQPEVADDLRKILDSDEDPAVLLERLDTMFTQAPPASPAEFDEALKALLRFHPSPSADARMSAILRQQAMLQSANPVDRAIAVGVRTWSGSHNGVAQFRDELDEQIELGFDGDAVLFRDAIRQAPPTDIELYRGMTSGRSEAQWDTWNALEPGDTINLDRIGSFSESQQHANRFGRINITMQPGANALPIGAISNTPEESEWLVAGDIRVVSIAPTGLGAEAKTTDTLWAFDDIEIGPGFDIVVEYVGPNQDPDKIGLAASAPVSLLEQIAEALGTPLHLDPNHPTDTDEFHLKGTPFDHDQGDHAGGRGARLGPAHLDERRRFEPPADWGDIDQVTESVGAMLQQLTWDREDGIYYEVDEIKVLAEEEVLIKVNIRTDAIGATWGGGDGRGDSFVGSAERIIRPGDDYMIAAKLEVDPNHRRKGVGTELQEGFEDLVAASGITEVRVEAVSIGRYAWARAGYDWAPFGADFAEIGRFIEGAVRIGKIPASDTATKMVAALSSGRTENLPTPFEVSELLGRDLMATGGLGDSMSTYRGKGTFPTWEGRKRLADLSLVAAAGEDRLAAVRAAYAEWWPIYPVAADPTDNFAEPGADAALSAMLVAEFHLQGQHDQATHGRRGGSEPDYHGDHRPNETGPRAFDLWESESTEGLDLFANPHFYTGHREGIPETMRQLETVRDDPKALLTVYRAAPEGSDIRAGDWVTLSRSYAEQHARSQAPMIGPDEYGPDLPVFEREVEAREVRWAMDDLMEWGYFPDNKYDEPAEFHLAGTANDHNQADHAGSGGRIEIRHDPTEPVFRGMMVRVPMAIVENHDVDGLIDFLGEGSNFHWSSNPNSPENFMKFGKPLKRHPDGTADVRIKMEGRYRGPLASREEAEERGSVAWRGNHEDEVSIPGGETVELTKVRVQWPDTERGWSGARSQRVKRSLVASGAEFHLAGTANDHNQADHAGKGGPTQAKNVPRLSNFGRRQWQKVNPGPHRRDYARESDESVLYDLEVPPAVELTKVVDTTKGLDEYDDETKVTYQTLDGMVTVEAWDLDHTFEHSVGHGPDEFRDDPDGFVQMVASYAEMGRQAAGITDPVKIVFPNYIPPDKAQGDVAAWVSSEDPTTINMRAGYRVEAASTKATMSRLAKDNVMASSLHVHDAAYTVLHEMAHVAQLQSGRLTRETMMSRRVAPDRPFDLGEMAPVHMSEYGWSSWWEMEAEGFAEWANTGGSTTNPIVRSLADDHDWTEEFAVRPVPQAGLTILEGLDRPGYQIDGEVVWLDPIATADEFADETMGARPLQRIEFGATTRPTTPVRAPVGRRPGSISKTTTPHRWTARCTSMKHTASTPSCTTARRPSPTNSLTTNASRSPAGSKAAPSTTTISAT